MLSLFVRLLPRPCESHASVAFRSGILRADMATIHPLKALRPPVEMVAQVAAPPYDVVTEAEARAFAAGKPFCFLRISRSEVDFPPGTDPYSPAIYDRAAENLAEFQRQGVLVPDQTAAIYVYRQRMGEHVQAGVVALCSVDEYDDDRIKKHEKTRQDKEDDRTRHIVRTRCQTGPVFLTYRDRPRITELMHTVMQRDPLYDFDDDRAVRHTVWRVDESDPLCTEIQREFEQVPALYIADGHHRAKSASRARAELRAANPSHTGDEPYNRFLGVMFPAGQLQILPYNRVVLRAPAGDVMARVRERFEVEDLTGPVPPPRGSAALYLGGRWYGIRPKNAPPDDPIEGLDVSVFQRELLGPVFGIGDPRTDRNIEFVGGIRDASELQAKADANGGAAILLHPTRIEDVLRVSDAGGVMPPKSTWFEPKLRSGMFVNPI
ncbi:MAG: hypothetical protein AMXMBFR61_00090 [Fimbriimonadales bacterium]